MFGSFPLEGGQVLGPDADRTATGSQMLVRNPSLGT
jgi:hypothetical protein